MVWDVTCPDTFASSYAAAASREPGKVAALAEERKVAKYAHLGPLHLFTPVAVETTGVIGQLTRDFLKDLGRRLRHVTGGVKAHSYIPPPEVECCSTKRQCCGGDGHIE